MTVPWWSALEGQTTLVLGGGGFIGRRVCRALEQRGARVLRGVRPGHGHREGESAPVDLAVPGAAGELVQSVRPAVTFNLAGYGVSPAERDAGLCTRINAELPAELAGAAGRMPRAGWSGLRLVHVGSALEYGTASGDLEETTTPMPTTLYGKTKLAGTEAIAKAAAEHGVAAITARLFTVYGPGERAGRLLPSLLAARADGRELPMTAGAQRRDFTFVDDVAEGLLRLTVTAGTTGAVVNLATGRLTTVREFVERAARVLALDARQLQFGVLAGRAEEMSHDPVNVGRLERLTGWKPTTDIVAGVEHTLREELPAAE